MRLEDAKILLERIVGRGCYSCCCKYEDNYGRFMCALLVEPITDELKSNERLPNCPYVAILRGEDVV